MTPELQQAIKLLLMSNIELTNFVETEMVENPLLEWDEGQFDNDREADRGDEKTVAEPFEGPDSAQQTGADTVPSDSDAPLDTSYDNVYDGDGIVDVGGDAPMAFADGRDGRGGRRGFADSSNDFDSTISSEKSLREYLNDQLGVDVMNKMHGVFPCMGNACYKNKLDEENAWIKMYENDFNPPAMLTRKLDSLVIESSYSTKTGEHYENRAGMINFSIVGGSTPYQKKKK